MSDFLFTRNKQKVNELDQLLKDLMPNPDSVSIRAYSGEWGSLAFSLGPYNGFEPYQDDNHICIVIGGPVLCWRDNHFLTDLEASNIATKSILERWKSGLYDWSEDLSGPFNILIIDKKTNKIFCYTDLMMFIPVYQYNYNEELVLGTHVDTVAKVADIQKNIDQASVADFILHGIVTYPYTTYIDIFQLAPASEHTWILENNKNIEYRVPYWQPFEINPYNSIEEAATALREGLNDYIESITDQMTEVGQFISGGEDSRSIAGMLPKRLKRHAYIYVDYENREFELAKRVSNTYGCEFHHTLRNHNHYLNILPVASNLVGSGQQYTHAHTLSLSTVSGVDKHLAVFGGYASDSLLKAMHIRKPKNASKFPFVPDIELPDESRTKPIKSSIINSSLLLEIDQRRKAHMVYIKSLRKQSYHEWFMLWPYSMREAMPNLSVNRRLFASYEIYTSKNVVKISAAIPTHWKTNRKLFNTALKPALAASKWIPHADGRLPYFPWYLNTFLQLPRWTVMAVKKLLKIKTNDGSWVSWEQILEKPEWKELVEHYSKFGESLKIFEENIDSYQVLNSNELSRMQKVNLLQVLYYKNQSL